MVHERLSYLMAFLNASCADISKPTGYSPTSVSRMRSGKRTPRKNSPTIQRFAEGVVVYARESGQIKKLCGLLNCEDSDDYTMVKIVIDWIYSDDENGAYADTKEKLEEFGSRLDKVIGLSGLKNKTLAEMAGIEYSYVSRLRNGQRLPRSGSVTLERICTVLYSVIRKNNKLGELSELTMSAEYNLNMTALRDWLCGLQSSEELVSVKKIITQLQSLPIFNGDTHDEDISVPETDTADSYRGIEGLKTAAVRFLRCAENEPDLYIYTDRLYSRCSDEFGKVWDKLVKKCLASGTKIHLIHNIDKTMWEAMEHIANWIPFYLCGEVDHRFIKSADGCFEHTILLCPEKGGVIGLAPKGAECTYEYFSQGDKCRLWEEYFKSLMENSQQLVTGESGFEKLKGRCITRSYDNVDIYADNKMVLMRKNDEPCITLKFYNEDMVKAFRNYMKQN